MSENEIKPVAWCAVDDMRNEWAFAWGGTGRRPWHDSPLYDQSAIDALSKQISELKTMLSIAEFQRKEMQAERDEAFAAADSKAGWEWKKRAEKAEAERDAAVADAERYRALIEYALAQHNGGHTPYHNHWAIKAANELSSIDAARAQEPQE